MGLAHLQRAVNGRTGQVEAGAAAGEPGAAAIQAVFPGGTGHQTAHVDHAVVGDVVGGAGAGVLVQRQGGHVSGRDGACGHHGRGVADGQGVVGVATVGIGVACSVGKAAAGHADFGGACGAGLGREGGHVAGF